VTPDSQGSADDVAAPDPAASAPAPSAPSAPSPKSEGAPAQPPAKPDPAPVAEPPHEPGRVAIVWAAVRRYVRSAPVTFGIVAVVLLVAVGSGSLWRDLSDAPDIYDAVAYGLPPLQAGKWWTPITGMFFVPSFVLYIPILALLIGAAGTYERRAGHWRTFVVVIGGQALAAALTSAFLFRFESSGWLWAETLSRATDLGISAGGFAALGALTATQRPPWKARYRVTVTAYLAAMVVSSGLLWDVEHFLAWLLGLFFGPILLGRAPARPVVNINKRVQRSLVALVIAVFAIADLIEAFFPGNGGPFVSKGQDIQQPGLTLGLAIGSIIMLLAADALRRGHRVAWTLITILTALAFASLFTVESSAERTAEFVLYGGQLLLLICTRRAFTARSQRRSFRRAGRRLLMVAIGLLIYTAVGFAILSQDFNPDATPVDMLAEWATRMLFSTTDNIVPETNAAKLFVGSIGAVWLGTILITIVGLAYSSRTQRPEPDQDDRIREMVRSSGVSSIDYMLTWEGNTIWFSTSGQTAIGYRVVGAVALALADPIGPDEERLDAMKEFDRFCFDRGWIPCLFAAGQATADLAPEVGWKSIQVAEDSVVPLPGLEFKGKAWQDVRTAMNKAGKQDITLQRTQWSELRPVYSDQLRIISSGWVDDKSLPEMGFTLGSLAEADDPEVRLHLAVDEDQTIEGFTSWMPCSRDGEVVGWTVDLMRRRDEGFRAVMEYLIGASAMQFKEEGYEFISLSAAPLAKAPERQDGTGEDRGLQRLLDFLGDILEPYYGFRSLLAFKAKFQPVFHPMYMIFPSETALGEIGIAIARAYMPTATLVDWVKIGIDMAKGSDEGH
jgi:phosphatidylglycerol lysyltransferase